MSKRTRRPEARTNWHRGCTSKKRYHSRDQAKRVRRSCMSKRPGTPLRIYECWHCGGWHLTHVHNEAVQS